MHVQFSHHWAVFISCPSDTITPWRWDKACRWTGGSAIYSRTPAELSRCQQPLPVYSFQSVVKKRPLYMIMPCTPERHKKSIKREICMKLTPITCCCRGNSALLETGAVCAWDWNEHASVQRVLSKDEPQGTFTTPQVPQHKFGELGYYCSSILHSIYSWMWEIHLSNCKRRIGLGSKRTFQGTVLKITIFKGKKI